MDKTDERILSMLQSNARRSFTDLGHEIGLSANATAARVRRLEEEGVILGYTVVTGTDTPSRRGGLEVFIDVRLRPETDYDFFVGRVSSIGEIVEAIHMTGPSDYLLHAYARDTSALDHLLRSLKEDCGAAQTQTRIAMR
ncbi:Lrp/AsnC family transcriptional regulator [Labedella phragmitis]|uniref:Lrp/AsnC family transcriptional regulator n=1 Tax=Labedella phragmitis TaxID=2498849 RepID=A0A444PXF4_9MICO|nr:Lrp/AsnC family transcriptional regulator [Labedella phragmitis]RWZ52570.1 Lrp/AsnC family transcriptional regulator [Labedella phragmitis]